MSKSGETEKMERALEFAAREFAKREGCSVSDWGSRLFELAVSGAWDKRARNAHMTPLEWLRRCIESNATPVDQTSAAQRRRTREALGED